jgi:hypothetical protein
MIRDDFLMRMIRQLAEVIARITGLAKAGRSYEAERALEEACGSFVGMPKAMIDKLDPETIAKTLGPEKAMIIAALLDAEASLEKSDAAERRARAAAVRAAAGLPPA